MNFFQQLINPKPKFKGPGSESTDLIIGNSWKKLGNSKKKNQWKVYVKNYDSYITKVVFHLHPTFKPNKFEVKQAPWELESVGWGTFEVKMDVTLKDGVTHTFKWMLQFGKDDDHKVVKVKSKNWIPKIMMQTTMDDPMLMESGDRHKHELSEKKEFNAKEKKAKEVEEKAKNVKPLVDVDYYFKKSETRRKGSPKTVTELTLKGSIYKYNKDSYICGRSSSRGHVQEVASAEDQKKVVDFIKNKCKLKDEKGEPKKTNMAKFTEKLMVKVGDTKYEIENPSEETTKQVDLLITFMKTLFGEEED